jgi:hypothetical protein
MEWPLLGNVQALDLRVPVSPVMATQPKARDTVYSTVRPELIYLGAELVSRVGFVSSECVAAKWVGIQRVAAES